MEVLKKIFGFLGKKPVAVKKQSVETLHKILKVKIPENALEYCLKLWIENPFNFRVSRSRKSVLGLYTYKNKQHYISVNGDSNPYSFLITFIHEIAHQHVTQKFSKNVNPHGQEWKNTFKSLLKPLQTTEIFPEDILVVLNQHMQNPAASSAKDPELVKVLAKYSPEKYVNMLDLGQLKLGEHFVFNNKVYKKLEVRRTRVLVEMLSTKKQYTIPLHASVSLLNK